MQAHPSKSPVPRRRRLAVTGIAVAALGAGALTITSANSALAEGFCEVEYDVLNDWGSGYQASVSIATEDAIDGWQVEWDFPAGTTVASAWNVDWSQSGTTFTGSDVGWNAQIGAGETREVFGFVANGSSALPDRLTVNGEICDGSVENPTGGEPTTDEPTDEPTSEPEQGTPIERHGQLSVCGTNLCGEDGEPVQLKGMSTHGLQWFADCVNDASLDALAEDWESDIVRLSMYVQEDGYETDPAGFTSLVSGLIDEVTSRGMYALVDWHILTPGDPNVNLEAARTFFAEIAEAHADNPGVLYETANEPNGVSWTDIKGYHEQIIPVIRERDPDSVIVLGTRAYSSLGLSEGSGPSEVVDNPVAADNVMYAFHFYAASHREDYLAAVEAAADRLPIFASEWGTQTYTGDGANDFAMSQRWTDMMAEHQISWTNWNFADDFRSGAALEVGTCPNGPFTGTQNLKPAGEWIRDQIRGD
ncbi:cellulase family glycosylhydrolase [Glycomyces sp. L485]|uniref:cellulase family glycosylhydrolase n=1 Tax=Glycomyces sp. L485 TaxID=2909235 RepID=UPI001F4A3F45|nr:cellulase family glycosylhydrolase [Glycomyces sp. L485]MCH7232551.1 cellulase family glycosylhydrolase [Glycomyces sp. L485]